MPIRKHKKYNKPRKLHDLSILKEEQGLIKKYGLKSRREVWRADYAITKIRDIAKSLITADEKDKKEFVERQVKKGFNVSTLADVLGLSKEDYLKRRLQSIVLKKGLARTQTQARQFITHKHVTVKGNIMDSPAHLTTLEEENQISVNLALPEKKIISDEEKEILTKIKPKEKGEKNE